MALTTYTELKAAVAVRLDRTDLTTHIVDGVTLFEAFLRRRLAKAGVTGTMTRSTATLTLDEEYIAVPADFAMPLSLVITHRAGVATTGEVLNSTLASIDRMRADYDPADATPTHFTTVGSEFRLYPIPDVSHTAQLIYQASFEALSGSVASNWVLESHPDLYLLGTCAQVADHTGDDRLPGWAAFVAASVDDLIASERAKRGSRRTPAFRSDFMGGGPAYNINTG